MSDTLHLVRLVFDRRALARVASRHRLPRNLDDGYLLHAGLAQLFATSDEPASVPLSSFAVDETHAAAVQRPDDLFVLGYAQESAAVLEARMGAARSSLLRLARSTDVPEFASGQRVEFRSRVCPVVRTRKPGVLGIEQGTDRRGKPKARELDAFVHATIGVPRETVVSREAVYVDWLRAQFEAPNGAKGEQPTGAHLEDARLVEFRRERTHRRESPATMERPNALMEGTLTVTDPAAFRTLLARGVGRHRAFGFGMLLLRPAR